ncbi:DUF3054 domain-containing protein [Haloarcula nitratireducens]|uniref:DUF3054 domain-containing protein n=1 Tax=Haloarcula nitratireducens TaxID=2487749 RepID=A0AAW4P7T7_9EURY|nr:DUF3054 domain-containing protein [Halomicroarcula nitratireducens]MBX0293801.1 DUF3054 domain-containing protein [Halomicroarcula nitratireducens]
MSVSTAGWQRIEPSSRTAVLAAGDLAAILLFVAAGEYQHGYNPLVDVGRVAGTFAPFLVGWALMAGAAGLYATDATAKLGRTLGVTAVSWILAVVVAMGLRATAVFHGGAALTFAVVSVLIGGTLLCLWRAIATLVLS